MPQLSDDDIFNMYNKTSNESSKKVDPQLLSDDQIFKLYTKGSKQPKLDEEKLSKNLESGKANPLDTSIPEKVIYGVGRGLKDVIDTGAHGLANATSFIASKVLPTNLSEPIRQSAEETINIDKAARDKFDQENKGALSPGQLGRVGGQILATAPLLPARAIQGIRAGWGALPTTLPSGAQVAAPVANRLAASAGVGAAGGAVYGAATSSTNEKSVPENILEGSLAGAVAGPVVTGAAAVGSGVIKGLKNVWTNNVIDKLVEQTGIAPKAAKSIIERLDEAGYTPATALIEARRLGPKATLADLDVSLTDEARGVAQLGGAPTSILKNTFSNRAAGANNDAVQIMESKLGPKPNIDAEKEAIVNQARAATGADYRLAHSSSQRLDVAPIAADIDQSLQSSVGKKTSVLQEIKGYLYRTDAQGNPQLKTSIRDLHEVRQGVDDLLERLPREGTSQQSSTYRAASDLRDKIDAQLKTNTQMAAADQKFAERMTVKSGLDTGYDALKKGTYEEFEKAYSSASPETKETIKKGMNTYVRDLMDQAQKGELSGAQRLFGQKSVNRKKLQLAFGSDADEILDALSKEAAFRATERAVETGSHTAANLAIANRYKSAEGGNFITDAIKAGTLDVVTGSPAIATGINAVRTIGRGAANRLLSIRSDRMAESSADLLSRQGAMRDNALDVLNAVSRVQNRISGPVNPARFNRLPVVGSPIGKEVYDKLNE